MFDGCPAISALEIIPIKDESVQLLGEKKFTGLQKQLREFWFIAAWAKSKITIPSVDTALAKTWNLIDDK